MITLTTITSPCRVNPRNRFKVQGSEFHVPIRYRLRGKREKRTLNSERKVTCETFSCSVFTLLTNPLQPIWRDTLHGKRHSHDILLQQIERYSEKNHVLHQERNVA